MSDVHSTVEYRDIPGFPGYRAGDDGSVWSCWRRFGPYSFLGNKWRRMKPRRNGDRHLMLRLAPGRKPRAVHQLILEAFVGPRPKGMDGCHRDDNKLNNALSNLRWDTRKANMQDCERNGHRCRGETHGRSALTEEQVLAIRQEHRDGAIFAALARKYRVAGGTILKVVRRLRWKHI